MTTLIDIGVGVAGGKGSPTSIVCVFNNFILIFQKALQVTAGQIARLRCESRGGNPAALIKWFIDDEELRGSSQKNETEIGDNRKWNAVSLIEIPFRKV